MSHESKTIEVTSILPAPKSRVFELLQQIEILKKVAAPHITFEPIDGHGDREWQPGKTYKFKTRLFGLIPYGEHSVSVMNFDDKRIYTNESNTHISVWNHEIFLTELVSGETEYTDKVEIFAWWQTYFVALWAKFFYKRRQKHWVKMLTEDIDDNAI